MRWWGKVLGGLFGYWLFGPVGAIIGLIFGHWFDKSVRIAMDFDPRGVNTEQIQATFFTTTFMVMGHLAKADGRVSESEIAQARFIMEQMQLSDEQKKLAIQFFNEGKSASFDLDTAILQFKRDCGRRRTLEQMFLEILITTAMADGELDPIEREILLNICQTLRFSRISFERLVAMIHAHRQYSAGGVPGQQPAYKTIDDAYDMLGVKSTASGGEVKKAYRKLMSQHHPDKLVSKGLPEEMIKLATEKTQEIKAAYEQVKKARDMN